MAANSPVPSGHRNVPYAFSPALRQRSNRSPALGSATQTVTNTPDRSRSPEPLVLRLRGAHSPQTDSADETTDGPPRRRRTRIQWAEDVIDNEGLGRKKSKVCCIYHKPRPVGESSDESSSDSSSESDSDSDAQRDGARPVGGGRDSRASRRNHDHSHDGEDACGGHDHEHARRIDDTSSRTSRQRRRPSPNAYEKMPKYDVKPLARQPGTGV